MIDYKLLVIEKPGKLRENFPQRVKIEGNFYWFSLKDGKLSLFYDSCAHMGGALQQSSNNFICTQHGWTYELNGRNHNPALSNLRKVKIISETTTHIKGLFPFSKSNSPGIKLKNSLKVAVHSHATLEFSYKDLNILFDPWLNGNTYYGSWELFPKPTIQTESLKINAVVITHPHPDHFHLPTLQKLSKSIPIYFPKFPSGIIQNGLNKLGFTNQFPKLWNEKFTLGPHVKMEFLRPISMWEDSATFTQIEDEGICFTWLNLVDAGAALDQEFLPPLDLLTSAFDQGASGYPLTWSHLSENRKVKILQNQKRSTMELIVNRANHLKALYFLPFAGHWRLAQPEHQKYANLIPHTSFTELKQKFDSNKSKTTFLDVYPGEEFDFFLKNKKLIVGNNYQDVKISYDSNDALEEIVLSDIEISKLFSIEMAKLQKQSEAFGVEKVNFRVKCSDNKFDEVFSFVSSISVNSEFQLIEVKIPFRILKLFASKNANWDHIAIGYWGEWNRSSENYPANFMRLLQSGTYQSELFNSNSGQILDSSIFTLLELPVGDLIEKSPENAQYFLTRLGLPCLSCVRSNSETLRQAFSLHNIDPAQFSWLLREFASSILV
jgi:CMP-N-acetylneuraminate monooxygenase